MLLYVVCTATKLYSSLMISSYTKQNENQSSEVIRLARLLKLIFDMTLAGFWVDWAFKANYLLIVCLDSDLI